MIYTVTCNPALDYIINLDHLTPGAIHRAGGQTVSCGGKGINVSRMLRTLGVQSVALGFVAGFTGKAMEEELVRLGIRSDFVRLTHGMSRINVKIRTDTETDINGTGPTVSYADFELLSNKLKGLTSQDTLVLAGSVPPSLGAETYARLMRSAQESGARTVVDAEGDLLACALSCRPFLIKPNAEELGALFSVVIRTQKEALEYAARLQERGARHVLVSLGADGAVLLTEEGMQYCIPAIHGPVTDTAGAGDAMLAGFLAGYGETGDVAGALRLAVAAGSATACCTGLARAETIDEFYRKIPADQPTCIG